MEIVRSDDKAFEETWRRLSLLDRYRYPLYQPRNLEYYREQGKCTGFRDLSFVVEEGGQPVVGVRIAANAYDGGRCVLSAAGVLPGYSIECPESHAGPGRKMRKTVQKELGELLAAYPGAEVLYADHLVDGAVTVFGGCLLEVGGDPVMEFRQVIDLTGSAEVLHAGIRKSYKSLINWGRRSLQMRVLEGGDVPAEEIERFRMLHRKAAGRETRARSTWMLQHGMIHDGEAFAVFGEQDGVLVTAGLFPCSPKHCFYGVAASDPERPDDPLSHVVLWTAILHAKERGCRWFELGQRLYSQGGESSTSRKEATIEMFKTGFGGRVLPRLSISMNG